MAGPVHATTHRLGELLKDVFRRSGTFHTESALHEAEAVVDAWVKAIIPSAAMRALSTGEQSAPREDVTKRTPPGGPAVVVAQAAPGIDYDKLAAALLAAQARQAASGADAPQQVMGQ